MRIIIIIDYTQGEQRYVSAAKKRFSGFLLMLAIITILAAVVAEAGSTPRNRHRQREPKQQQPLPRRTQTRRPVQTIQMLHESTSH